MKLFLNNMDGAGLIDYTAALCPEMPLRIVRRLNEMPMCAALLDVSASPVPVKHARVQVETDAGAEIFSGYVIAEPVAEYAGVGVAGSVFRLLMTAAGDAWVTGESTAWSLGTAGAVTHVMTEADGTIEYSPAVAAELRELAEDVTLSGELEPSAMIQEIFTGDGTTTEFDLNEKPFHETPVTLLSDGFAEAAIINTAVWAVNDTASYVSLTGGGLTFHGGNGADGQTTVQAVEAIEMGGSLMAEASRVSLNAGSDGVLCGLYQGAISMANLFAGFRVKVVSGAVTLVAMVSGAEVGTPFTVAAGHIYTLRLRAFCMETQRVMESFYSLADGVVQQFGGGLVDASVRLTFEVQDLGLSSAITATVLYDGAAVSSPAQCTFVAANSIQLNGSVGGISISRPSSMWVVSTLPSGTKQTRLIGAVGEGVDCSAESTGKVTFYAGRVPVANELVTVFYRNERRAVARMTTAASVADAETMGLPNVPRWTGKLTSPAARSSADCEAATQAFLNFATSRSATQTGKCVAVNPTADIMPGDLLQMPAHADTVTALVREVSIADQQCVPEMLEYTVQFANVGEQSVSMRMTDLVASDAVVPANAATAPCAALENLQQVTVVNATAATLQLDAGRDAPAGGGFEVRRRDWDFGTGSDADLVLRSPTRSIEIPRVAKDERYFVRMYDASSPPVYSRFSAAVYTHVPVS